MVSSMRKDMHVCCYLTLCLVYVCVWLGAWRPCRVLCSLRLLVAPSGKRSPCHDARVPRGLLGLLLVSAVWCACLLCSIMLYPSNL